MEPPFQEDGWRSLDALMLAAAVVIVALTVYAFIQLTSLWIPVLGAVALLLQGLGYMRLNVQRRLLHARLRELEHSLIGQHVTDTETGAALPGWFSRVLETECRRAVRDFTPLTLMQLEIRCGDPAVKAASRVRLASMLTAEISRPGDLVGLGELGDLQLLLPATNENAEALAKRCIEHAVKLMAGDEVEVRLAGCTLQPKSDLTPDKVLQQLSLRLDEVRAEPAGSVSYRAEPTSVETLNSAYSL
ncbi:hypothetical protein GCM10011352_29010 [Marinobacterium zhoushanense]|uniref:GGDEF domain-containing protein n=1 Tax=Marinobacterium zhoushanense TaxID=1679163 RepID=A0ABQ1KM48_9GAMM|nr:hypothetical protein [Marinobacterium zhoushanense]GGC01033.1 hypothetical protein GCM10011352_29010 [Marinobacterium zhoushanense]